MPDETFPALLGEEIGRGVNRTVHAWAGRDDVVIKAHLRLPCRANHTEWLLYNQMRPVSALAPLFARVWALSDSGRYLVMERLRSLPENMPLPTFPAFLIDRKRENFGLSITGQIRCLDYGDINLADTLAASPLTL